MVTVGPTKIVNCCASPRTSIIIRVYPNMGLSGSDSRLASPGNSCSRDIQGPANCRLVIVPAGVIYANLSDIGIDGNASFTRNSAGSDGGEQYAERAFLVTLVISLVVIPCRRALFQPIFTFSNQRLRRPGL